MRLRTETRGKQLTNRSLLILVAICFSTTAFAQSAPKVGNKPPVRVKPKEPAACNSLERSEAQSYGLVTASE